jgi:hypothetical protein
MDQGRTVVIGRGFNGPRLSGNGGYVAGVLAQHIDPSGAVEVTLRAPVPIDEQMTLTAGGDGRHLLKHGERLICEARPAALTLEPPGLQDWETAERLSAAGGSTEGTDFHWCIVCGRGRPVGDGLRVFGQRVDGKPMSLALYRPHAVHAAADGRIDAPFLWGTLDCPGVWAVQEPDDWRPAMTGRMVGQVFHRPVPGDPCMVVGWRVGAEGRKLFAGTALYTRTGVLCAMALSTWIIVI